MNPRPAILGVDDGSWACGFRLGEVVFCHLSCIRVSRRIVLLVAFALPGRAMVARAFMILVFRPPRWGACLMYVTPFLRLRPRLPVSSRVVPLLSVMVAGVLSLLAVLSVTWRFG